MTTANEGSEHGRPLCLALTDLLGLLDEWAKASGTHFAARSAGLQTTDTVSRDDLLQLMRAVEAAERERCARKPLTAQELDKLIEAHVGGAELADGEYSAMVLFAAAVERAHGIEA